MPFFEKGVAVREVVVLIFLEFCFFISLISISSYNNSERRIANFGVLVFILTSKLD